MKERLTRLLGVEPEETGPVALLLAISFLMGLFLATVSVAAQTLFLSDPTITEKDDLPVALLLGGAFGFLATGLFNILQGRMPFRVLATIFLILIIGATAFFEFGDAYVKDISTLYYVGFSLILPFTFVTNLVFWGSFNRLFTLRQAKRVVGSVDIGTDIAQIIAFFTIPVLLQFGVETKSLFTIGLFAIIGFLVFFLFLSKYLGEAAERGVLNEKENKKLTLGKFITTRYIFTLSLFIIISFIALRFIDYSFYNITTVQFDSNQLPYFLSFFEATVVITGFLFGFFATDKIQEEYGLKISLIINPLLLIIFTGGALALGFFFGYDPTKGAGDSIVFFFIAVAMSKLFINSLRDALDSPVFKFYYVPIEKSIKLDAQTKIEGIVTAFATVVAGGLIVLINQFHIFDLLSITAFTVPILVMWYLVINRMYHGYRDTLQNSLQRNRSSVAGHVVREFTLNSVLEKEVNSSAEDKVIYGLKLMEKLEPALFETSIVKLADSNLKAVKKFAQDKMHELGLENTQQNESETLGLARQAAGASEDSDLLSISADKLMKLGKSVKQSDRVLAAKLLRNLVSQRTIFILLELLRDADPKVRQEAILTARKVKRPETWPVLIDMLSSPVYSNQATAALKESGAPALMVLDTAFYKSGQTDQVMLKIVQIMGSIGGEEAWQLLWKKSDYPDKRIVKQIFYSLRFTNYSAKGRERRQVMELLDTEIGKTLWNLCAQEELPDAVHFSFLKEALREELRDNYDQISLLLSILYDPQSVQLVRENVETGTTDGIAYALELMDLFVDQELKPKLFPLFDDIAVKDKMNRLQVYFPRESYNPVQVVNYVLNRDFNLNNRWTKMCAVYASAFIPEFRVSRGLIGQMFNPDRLLQETAAWVIFNKDKAQYQKIAERLPLRDKKFLDSAIENNQLLDGLDDGFFLGIEMVMFIKALPQFKGIPGSILSDLADKIIPIDLKQRDKILFNNPDENRPILIVAVGEVKLREGATEVGKMTKGSVFGDLFQEGPSINITEVEAQTRSVVFRINLPDFYFVMAKHHELVQGLVRNVTKKEEKTEVV